jgi:hypothetical protein
VNCEDVAGSAAPLRNRLTTVKYLVTRRAPPSLPDTRLPFERRVFTVVASVTLVRHEEDSDIHLVLVRRGFQMIAEALAPYCDRGATPRLHRLMAKARTAVRLCSRARVTAEAFFDADHGQNRCRAELDPAAPDARFPLPRRLVPRLLRLDRHV